VEGREEMIVGELMLRHPLSKDREEENYSMLNRLLNDGNPFDVELVPVKKDRLCLTFTCRESDLPLYYGFEYTGRKWKRRGFDSLEWRWHHEKVQGGKIANALRQ
jgi:hypothetical protein